MEWWNDFVAWLEANPWRFNLALALLVFVLGSLFRPVRTFLVHALRIAWGGVVSVLRRLGDIRVTTRTRIEAEIRAAVEDSVPTVPDPPSFEGWRLHRDPRPRTWRIENASAHALRLDEVFPSMPFLVDALPIVPVRVQAGGHVLLRGYIANMEADPLGWPATLTLKWADSHGDEQTAREDLVDGASFVPSSF